MPSKRRRSKKRKNNRSRNGNRKRRALFILIVIAASIFIFFNEFGIEKTPKKSFDIFSRDKKPFKVLPEISLPESLPKIAIVIDDMGASKKKAQNVFNISRGFTLSILPHQVYSVWIANEGNRLGHDIILHMPMEAARPLRLGKGGLFTWMSNQEIAETINGNIKSVPHIKGASNHMGSAFTMDKRSMSAVISELKKRRLFFLDSKTSAKTIAYDIAVTRGVKVLQRDVFLDDNNNPDEIQVQWNRLLKIAKKKGYAIALAHPRKNTLDFLQKTLKKNGHFAIVPITRLLD
jgi:polysaccharide deacetylase 2 family uncharacterized protein YibQ